MSCSSCILNTRRPLKITSPFMDKNNGIEFKPSLSSNSSSIDKANDVVGNIKLHHTAVKTRNITLAIQFYSLLGFEPSAKFKAGSAKAAWLEQRQASPINGTLSPSRIELIEVPAYLLREPEGMKRRALNLWENQLYLGHNHVALDVTEIISNSDLPPSSPRSVDFLLSRWMELLNKKSLKQFRKSLRVALEAEQFMVGSNVYERAFIYDADGALIELLRKAGVTPTKIDPLSGWERYDGPWFEGKDMDTGNDETII